MHPIRLVVRALGAAALTALVATLLPALTAGANAATATAGPSAPALDPASIDPTCKPCDDFYQFATGGWRKANSIPAGHPSWGSFDELAQRNREALHAILEDAAKDTAAPPGSDTQKLGTFYRACMDEAAIERDGTTPIAPLLSSVSAVGDAASLSAEIAKLQLAGVSDGLDFSSEPDTKDSSKTISTIGLGGLGLPDRDYYLNADERSVKIRSAYHDYVATQLQNLGDAPADAGTEADAIVALETAFAKAMPTRAALRDPKATYHPTPVTELGKLGPHLAWSAFFTQFNAPPFDSIDVSVPAFVTAYDAQLGATPLSTWKSYLRFHVADAYARALPKRFVDASFAFRSGVLSGIKTELPRWQRCTSAADRSLGTPLGKAYVARNFPPAAKARALQMVDNLQATLRSDIGTLSWMGPQTKR
ncbi:MAG: M13 family metallopeptidase N-terminal domain-containing protein, partial [Candidatus Elarobacter sp.]